MVGFHAATRLACDALHNSAIDAWAPHTQTGTNARCAAMMIRPYKLPRDSARSALLTAVSLISIWAERVGFHATGSLCPFARRLRSSIYLSISAALGAIDERVSLLIRVPHLLGSAPTLRPSAGTKRSKHDARAATHRAVRSEDRRAARLHVTCRARGSARHRWRIAAAGACGQAG